MANTQLNAQATSLASHYYITRGSSGLKDPLLQSHLIANPDLTVVVHGGDGDLMGKGAGHFVALGRNSWSDNFNLNNARQLL